MGRDFFDAEALDAMAELIAEDGVAVADHESGRRVSGNASTICWAVQAALGNSVKLK